MTEVTYHKEKECEKEKKKIYKAQSCPTLSDPMDCGPPGSSIHGIFQARVLEWGAIAFSDEWYKISLLQNLEIIIHQEHHNSLIYRTQC